MMQTMLKWLALGAAGIEPDGLVLPDFARIMQCAAEQGVWQMVFAGVKSKVAAGEIQLSPEAEPVYQALHKKFMQSCILHEQKNGAVLKIISELKANNIECCLLKGQSLSYMYAYPECRISSDIDLLIRPEDEAKALEIFRAHGFNAELRGATSNHDKLEHPVIGVVELHVSLYYDIEHDVWFDNLDMQQDGYMHINGMTVLGITDGYLYTLLHAIRHFVRSGLGAKQILDVLLYEKYYKNQLDADRIRQALRHLKYDLFTDTLKGFGVTYLGFSASDFLPFTFENERVEALLRDVSAGGVFGKKEDRRDCFDLYNACRFATFKQEDFSSFMTKWYRRRTASTFSFSTANMQKRYAYVKKNKALLPLAWCQHVGTLVRALLRKVSNLGKNVRYTAPEPTDKLMEERMQLYKYFDMV